MNDLQEFLFGTGFVHFKDDLGERYAFTSQPTGKYLIRVTNVNGYNNIVLHIGRQEELTHSLDRKLEFSSQDTEETRAMLNYIINRLI